MNRQMTVTQLSRYLKGVFDDEELLHDVTLSGEVSDVSYSDKHTFLVLSEGGFSVRCIHFSSRDKIEKGARVALRGSVGFYDKRTSVTFTYTEFFIQGVGDMNIKLAELKQKLSALGYFENRPQLPKYIVSVAVITSPDGAAICDFMRVVHDKNPFVDIKVYPSKVQGEGAAAQIAEAINKLQTYNTDAIVLCRGGGSDEDLGCFNDETLAVAVANSRIPIISAVGHEIDYTLCDYCAGTRAGTPSIAGEIVNSRASAILTDLFQAIFAVRNAVKSKYDREVMLVNKLGRATTASVSTRIYNGYHKLRFVTAKGAFGLQNRLSVKSNRLSSEVKNMRQALSAKLSDGKAKVDKLSSLLGALDPHRIIKVGYAAVLRSGQRVMAAAEIASGDEVGLVFADGVATAKITNVKRENKE